MSHPKATNQKVEGLQVGGVRAGCLVLVSQSEFPSLLQIQPSSLPHQAPRALRHQTHTGPTHKPKLAQLLPGYATFTEVQKKSPVLYSRRGVATVVVVEMRRGEKECVCSIVHFGRHGNVEEEEIVTEVLMSEGVR